jgi:acyl-CoA oxidase
MVDAAVRTSQKTEDNSPRIDVERVEDLLLGTWADTRRQSRELIKDPAFWRDDSLGKDEHRERVLTQLHLLVENGAVHRAFPKKFGGEENNGANIAGFEELVAADPSLQIKSGVQWGLFGSAVLQLGTEEHHKKWLPGIMNLEIPGAFAMTEIGHGSDVAAVGTTATYDPETDEAPPRSTSATRPCTASRPRCSRSSSRTASTTACTASTCRCAARTATTCRASAAKTTGSRGA